MRYVHCLLLLALCFLAGCGTPGAQQPASTQVAAATASATATSSPAPSPTQPAPTQPAPTATFIPTAAPAATTQPATPTAEPVATTVPPTPTAVPPTAAPEPTGPAEFIVVSRGETLISVAPDGSTRPIEIEGIELRTSQVVASSDGSWIAGPTKGYENPDVPQPPLEPGLVLYNISSGERQVLPQAGTVGNIHFAPDNASLVFTTQNWETMTWHINVLDLRARQQRILQEGVDAESFGLVPTAWTPEGILAYKHLVFGADGGPKGLFLINLHDPTIRTIIEEGYIHAVAAPNGQQIAIVNGLMGLGIENPSFSLSVHDLVSGETTPIEPEQPGGLGSVSWSPDSTKLLYQQPGTEWKSGSYVIAGPALREPQRLTLPVAMEQFRELSWRDNNTLLVLVEDGNADTLYELPIAAPDASNLKQIVSIPSSKQHTSSVVYIAR